MAGPAVDLSWFAPEEEGAQVAFINHFGKETVYAGGVGSGKTLAGCMKALVASQTWPGGVGLIGRQSYRALEDTTKKVMIYGDDKPAVLPLDSPLVREYRKSDETLELANGSTILFRSLEAHNIEKLLSLNLAWFYVDECTETTLNLWMTLMGRLRHPVGPRCGWGTTNPNGHDWVWRRFHPDSPHDKGKSARRMFIQPTEANRRHLAPDYIRMLRSMPQEWQKRFVDASFDTAAGQIWDAWNRQVHVYDPDVVGPLPAHWKRFWAMDHGRRNPTCVLFFCVDPDGNVIVEDEYYEAGRIPSAHAPVVISKAQMIAPGVDLASWGPLIAPPDVFRADPNGKTVEGEYLDAWRKLEERGDIEFVPRLTQANDNVGAGLLRVDEWMQRDERDEFPEWHPLGGTTGVDGLGAPRFFMSEKCVETIGEIPDYRWKDLSPALEGTKEDPEEPRKLNDHGCDTIRYGLMSRPRPRIDAPRDKGDERLGRDAGRAITAGLHNRRF